MSAIGQLDEDHADVLHHRHHHLTEVLCLCFLLAAERNFVQLAYPFHQLGNGIAKGFSQIFLVVVGVLNHVVQQRSHQRFVIKMHISQNTGHSNRVSNVGIATGSHLSVMGFMS